MLLTKKVLSAVVGLGMLAMPAGALASDYYARPVNPHPYAWRVAGNHAPLIVADDWDHHHHHDQDYHHHDHDWNHHDHDWHGAPPPPPPGAYNRDDSWGGRYHYQYPPSYFSRAMPNGYGASQRHDTLMHQKQMAEDMYAQAQARGDSGAQSRLASTIANINGELRRTP